MPAQYKGLPLLRMTINPDPSDDTGVELISLVDEPAIQSNWVAFAKQQFVTLAVNKKQQMLTGAVMIPDYPIYRSWIGLTGECYVYASKDDVKAMMAKYGETDRFGIYDSQHDGKIIPARTVENWITTEGDQKALALGIHVPVGTWMQTVKITDSKFWNDNIETGKLRGFSITALLNFEQSDKELNQQYTQNHRSMNKFLAFFANLFTDSQKLAEDAAALPPADATPAVTYQTTDGKTFTGSDGMTYTMSPEGAFIPVVDPDDQMMPTAQEAEAMMAHFSGSLENILATLKLQNEQIIALNKRFDDLKLPQAKGNPTAPSNHQNGTGLNFNNEEKNQTNFNQTRKAGIDELNGKK